MKLKFSKRPVKTARAFGDELRQMPNGITDMFGLTILASIGGWANARNKFLQLAQEDRKKTKRNRHRLKVLMHASLGCAIAQILVVASKWNQVVTFDIIDNFIVLETEKFYTEKVDWALGVFSSAYAKWCTNVTCIQEPDKGVAQQMLQLMLNAVGLMCFLMKRDPIVDCFYPVYDEILVPYRKQKKRYDRLHRNK